MTEEQLQQAVNKLDQDVEELNAWSKVEESARTLREVIEKHPQSRAAEAAKAALQMIEQNRSPLVPIPDQRFERKNERHAPPADVPFTEPREPKV